MSLPSLPKSSVLQPLNLQEVDDLNLALIELGEALKADGKQVPDEFVTPEAYDSITKDHLTMLRDFIQQGLQLVLPPTAHKSNNALAKPEENAITSTEPLPLMEFSPQVLQGARETLLQLYAHLSEMSGIEIADVAWDAFDEAFSERNEVRFQAALGAVTNELEVTFNRLQQRSNGRKERQGATLGKFHQSSEVVLSRAKQLMEQTRLLTASTAAQEK